MSIVEIVFLVFVLLSGLFFSLLGSLGIAISILDKLNKRQVEYNLFRLTVNASVCLGFGVLLLKMTRWIIVHE